MNNRIRKLLIIIIAFLTVGSTVRNLPDQTTPNTQGLERIKGVQFALNALNRVREWFTAEFSLTENRLQSQIL